MPTMPKDFKALLRRLEKEGIVVGRDLTGRHPMVLLACGRRYPVSSTPSDWRSLANTEAQIRRLHNREDSGYNGFTLKRNGLPKD